MNTCSPLPHSRGRLVPSNPYIRSRDSPKIKNPNTYHSPGGINPSLTIRNGSQLIRSRDRSAVQLESHDPSGLQTASIWTYPRGESVMFPATSSTVTPPMDLRNVLDDRIRPREYSTRLLSDYEKAVDGSVVVVQPSFDDHDDKKVSNSSSPVLRSHEEWQARSPQQDRKDHTKDDSMDRNQSSPPGNLEPRMTFEHERNRPEQCYDAPPLDRYTNEYNVQTSDTFERQRIDDKKHRRTYADEELPPTMAHTRQRHHNRDHSAGLDILSSVADATKEELAAVAGSSGLHYRRQVPPNRPEWEPPYQPREQNLRYPPPETYYAVNNNPQMHPPQRRMAPPNDSGPPRMPTLGPPGHHSYHPTTHPPHYAPHPGSYPHPSGSYPHPTGPYQHPPTTNYPSQHQPYPPQHHPPYPHQVPHQSYYMPPIPPRYHHPEPVNEGYPHNQQFIGHKGPSDFCPPEFDRPGEKDFNKQYTRVEGPPFPPSLPEKEISLSVIDSHHLDGIPSSDVNGSRLFTKVPVAEADVRKSFPVTSQLEHFDVNRRETYPTKSDTAKKHHHRKLSSFNSVGFGTMFGGPLLSPGAPDTPPLNIHQNSLKSAIASNGKRPHHRSLSSVSFLNVIDNVLGHNNDIFLRNLQESEPGFNSPTNVPKEEIPSNSPLQLTRMEPGPTIDEGDEKNDSKLASGGTSKRVRRKCTMEGCMNRVVQGGLCINHGAKRKVCAHPDCSKKVKKAGLCSTHGPARKRCDTEGCGKVAVQGGRCVTHGARKKQCYFLGCDKLAILSGLCKKHHDQNKDKDPSGLMDYCREVPVRDGVNKSTKSKRHKPSHTRGLSIFLDMSTDAVQAVLNNPSNIDNSWS